MKYLFILLGFFHWVSTNAQQKEVTDSINSFLSNYCDKNTNNMVNSRGVRMHYVVPCTWTQPIFREIENVVSVYMKYLNDSITFSSVITIEGLTLRLTNEELEKRLTPSTIRELVPNDAVILSGTKTKVNSFPSAEIVYFKTEENVGLIGYFYFVTYKIFNKKNLITILYSMGCTGRDKVKPYLNKFILLAKGLTALTIFSD